MQPESSLLCSHEPDIGLYPEADESKTHPYTLFFKINFNVLLSMPSLPNGLFSLVFQTKTLCVYIISPMHAPSILSYVIW
jgi:hypothetical protein